MRLARFLTIAVTILLLVSTRSGAQAPLGITSARNLTGTPVFEGWYENPGGTFTISFDYTNRNWEEALDIPFGKDNFIESARCDGPQPPS
jgi:hypothetical protein